MINKIQRELAKGVYACVPTAPGRCSAYQNTQRGWMNYLIGGNITFSHRYNDYTNYSHPDSLEMHEYYELIIYSDGNALQYIADRECFTVPQGAALLIKPFTMHLLRKMSLDACKRYVINFRAPETLFPDKTVLQFLSQGNEHYALFLSDQNVFTKCAMHIADALRNDTSALQNATVLVRMTELFIELSKSHPTFRDMLQEQNTDTAIPQQILDIKDYIDREYANIQSVSELATRFHYHRDYLSRIFRQYFNTPVYEYILRRRLMYCCTLLVAGESVDQAAKAAGFSNRASYTKLFRKHFNCTPSEYLSLR